MDTKILAIIIQEGSRLASEFIRNKSVAKPSVTNDSLEKFINDSDARLSAFTGSEEKAPQQILNINIPKETLNIEPKVEPKETETEAPPQAEPKATQIATGCIPCATGHLGTCSGILNESLRFAHGLEGMRSPEVIDRVSMCLDELNAMERIDLRPEMTVQLNGWEKELAEKVLAESRGIRHKLEAIKSVDDLEQAAAHTQSTRKDIGRQWYRNKLSTLPAEDQQEVARRVMAKFNELSTKEK
jgi:hypothetical protein